MSLNQFFLFVTFFKYKLCKFSNIKILYYKYNEIFNNINFNRSYIIYF